MKAATLESKFPILSVEHDCIISKDADITVCYRVELPELFTVTQAEYEAIHSAWDKAVKVLPNYSIVHKQDIFIEETTGQDSLSPFGMRMVDRLTGKPIYLDISDLPMELSVTSIRIFSRRSVHARRILTCGDSSMSWSLTTRAASMISS